MDKEKINHYLKLQALYDGELPLREERAFRKRLDDGDRDFLTSSEILSEAVRADFYAGIADVDIDELKRRIDREIDRQSNVIRPSFWQKSSTYLVPLLTAAAASLLTFGLIRVFGGGSEPKAELPVIAEKKTIVILDSSQKEAPTVSYTNANNPVIWYNDRPLAEPIQVEAADQSLEDKLDLILERIEALEASEKIIDKRFDTADTSGASRSEGYAAPKRKAAPRQRNSVDAPTF